jgi:hypothetical protein
MIRLERHWIFPKAPDVLIYRIKQLILTRRTDPDLGKNVEMN